jgi:starvation-inducible DNA-binding protein
MHRSKIDLSEKIRAESCVLLQRSLSENLDLVLMAKQAHWNVRGPQFLQLHELFDAVYSELNDSADELAERLVQLGGTACGTSQSVVEKSSLAPYPAHIHEGMAHLESLCSAIAHFGKNVRASINHSAEINDAGTSDLFTGISKMLDKTLWKLEAHFPT